MQKSSSKQEQSCKVVFENSKSVFLSGFDENPPRTCPGAVGRLPVDEGGCTLIPGTDWTTR